MDFLQQQEPQQDQMMDVKYDLDEPASFCIHKLPSLDCFLEY
jgi:hypothetical protein